MRRTVRILWCAAAVALGDTGAFADTGILGYGGPGNALNPAGQPMDLFRDPNGL